MVRRCGWATRQRGRSAAGFGSDGHGRDQRIDGGMNLLMPAIGKLKSELCSAMVVGCHGGWNGEAVRAVGSRAERSRSSGTWFGVSWDGRI
ncbi:hypothetical protein M0R45_001140 [Rubus argutus]|uniref:Uncharacterized protein n=1 Tax=Rubus argutus TaxID=59490 RepID=A0AAW1VIN4_RUBAR